MNLKQVLQEYGLKETYAKVYLACLELGSSSILKISRRAKVPRSTTEIVLGSLQKTGFVSSFQKKRAKYYSPQDPKKLVKLAKEKSASLEKALPQFLAHYNQSNVIPTVRLYSGTQEMKGVLKEILEDARSGAKELLSFGSAEHLFDLLDNDFYDFVKERVKTKMPARVILKDSEKARERLERASQELRKVKLISPDYVHTGIIFIWGNKVAMFSLKGELSVLLMDSEELAETQKRMFESLWDSLPEPQMHIE